MISLVFFCFELVHLGFLGMGDVYLLEEDLQVESMKLRLKLEMMWEVRGHRSGRYLEAKKTQRLCQY